MMPAPNKTGRYFPCGINQIQIKVVVPLSAYFEHFEIEPFLNSFSNDEKPILIHLFFLFFTTVAYQ